MFGSAGNQGYVAIAAIARGETVMMIPAHLHITSSNIAEYALPRQLQEMKSLWEVVPIASHYLQQVEQREADVAAGNPDSDPWGPYWDSVNFAAVDGALVFWPEEELESLGRSEAYEALAAKRSYEEIYGRIVSTIGKAVVGRFEMPDFLRALLWVNSRHFGDYSVNVVPVAELFNHNSFWLSNLDFELQPSEEDSQHLSLTAKRDIRSGEELSITYGDHSNAKLLRQYSFTIPPSLEPTLSFRVLTRHIREDLLPDLDLDLHRLGPDLELMTTQVRVEQGDDEQYTAFHNAIASITDFVGETGVSTFERVLSFYSLQLERDEALAPFVAQLQKNREANRSSHVWWAEQGEAESVDGSAADAVGGRRRSDAIRSKMGQLLCLTVHREALQLLRGEILREEVLPQVEVLRDHLALALRQSLQRPAGHLDAVFSEIVRDDL